MNILQVSAGLIRIPPERGGGVEGFLFNISKCLASMGHSVTILDGKFLPDETPTEYHQDIKVIRLASRHYSFSSLQFLQKFSGLRQLAKSVLGQTSFAFAVKKYLDNAEDFDLIHIHPLIVAFVLTLLGKKLRKKLLYTSHVGAWLLDSPGLFDKVCFVLERHIVTRVGKVTVLNELLRQKLATAARVYPHHIKVIPVGVDTSTFKPGDEVDDVRERYGINGRHIILLVGRISPDKGTEYLIRAANIVVNSFDCRGAEFLLVGPIAGFGPREASTTSYYDKVLRLIRDYELEQNVKLIGSVCDDDLSKLYRICHIFVLPSLVEATPQVTLQAMASGKPVIGTKVGGILEQIRNGCNGFLIPPANEQELAEKIKYLMDNPEEAETMGANGRRVAQEEFDWMKITEKLLKIYQA